MELFSKVKLNTDKYSVDGIKINSVGIVLDKYDSGDYEVQFLDINGDPSDMFFSVQPTEIEKVED